MNKITKYGVYLIFIALFLILPVPVFSSNIFQDNFDSYSEGTEGLKINWERVDEPGGTPCNSQWEIRGGKIGISISGQGYCSTNLVPKDFYWNNLGNNYTFDLDMYFVNGTDHNIAFRFTNNSPSNNWYELHFGSPGDFSLDRVNEGTYTTKIPRTYSNGNNYHITIIVNGNNIKVYINGSLVRDYISNTDRFPTGKIALRAGTGATSYSETWFDNIVVTSIDETTPTQTPTPTPTPSSIIPIVVIPGHGACFNHEAIIHGANDVPQDQWHLWPFLHEYDGLLNSINNSGYQLNQDLFLFCYDWRKRLDQTADVLKDFIQNKVLFGRTDVSQVKVVGHSLGGMVGRSFAQKYNGDNLERLITVGSPHKGAVQSYYAWEGGESPGEINLGWFAWQILIQTQKKGFTTNVETVRNVAPSTLDLFPTFNFLKLSDTSEKDFRSMIWKNNWLFDLNNSLPDPPFLDKATALIGQKGDTPAWYKITTRSWLDELLGKWEDGKPTPTLFENGDLTILEKSGQIPGEPPESQALDHGELVRKTDGIRKILELLDIPESSIEEGSKLKITPSLLFLLGSPADIQVTDPDGNIFDGGDDKMVFIPEAKLGNYNLKINPDGGSKFTLFINQETDNKSIWNEINGSLDGTPLFYQIYFNPEEPYDNPIIDNSGIFYLNFAKEKILLLKKSFRHTVLDWILNEIEKTKQLINDKKNHLASQKIVKIIEMLFGFRINNSLPEARNISFEAIGFLAKAFKITTNNSGPEQVEREIKTIEKLIKSTEVKLQKLQKLGKLKPSNGVSFELATKQLEKAQVAYGESQLARTKILLNITQNLLKESLILQ